LDKIIDDLIKKKVNPYSVVEKILDEKLKRGS
jgi:hypothetical protein